MSDVTLHLGDCLEVMRSMPDKSVDAVVTDPPYGYLKHKLDRPFDEQAFFGECKRIIKKDGFYVGFGRGESFYRWNTILADLGFKFKEEVIWDKRFYAGSINKFIGDKYRFSQDERIALEGDEMISIGKFVNELNGVRND